MENIYVKRDYCLDLEKAIQYLGKRYDKDLLSVEDLINMIDDLYYEVNSLGEKITDLLYED